MHQLEDKYGRPVKTGSKVRLIELSPTFLELLPLEEQSHLKSMIGEIFEVYEIDQYGFAWIGKGWSTPDQGQYIGHAISLAPHEMERIDTD